MAKFIFWKLDRGHVSVDRDFADVILACEDDQLKKLAGQVQINWLSQQQNQKKIEIFLHFLRKYLQKYFRS